MIGRILLVLVIAFAVGLYFPESRAVIADYASPVVDPYLSMSTEAEMEDILDEVKTYQRENFERLPSERDFDEWIEARFAGEGSVDGWGRGYEYRVDRGQIYLISWGPDGERGTEDDIQAVRPVRAGGG